MVKHTGPLLGYNNNVPHKGQMYHVQTEDSGSKRPHVITHLFRDGGRIVKTMKTSYDTFVGGENLADKVRSLMREQHKGMVIQLRDGLLDVLIDEERFEMEERQVPSTIPPEDVKAGAALTTAAAQRKARIRARVGASRAAGARGRGQRTRVSSRDGTAERFVDAASARLRARPADASAERQPRHVQLRRTRWPAGQAQQASGTIGTAAPVRRACGLQSSDRRRRRPIDVADARPAHPAHQRRAARRGQADGGLPSQTRVHANHARFEIGERARLLGRGVWPSLCERAPF